MHNNLDASLALAKEYLDENSKNTRTSSAKLIRRLKSDKKMLSRLYKYICDNSQSSEITHFSWLADNYYVIERTLQNTLSALKTYKNLQSSNDGFPRGYGAIRVFFDTLGKIPTAEDFGKFIKVYCNTKNTPYFCDLYACEYLANAAIICSLCDVCREYIDTKTKENYAEAVVFASKRAVVSLKGGNTFDISKHIHLSKSEKILCDDPAGAYFNMEKQTKAYYRTQLCNMALKKGVPETSLAEKIVEKCKASDNPRQKHVGYHLVHKSKAHKVYYPVIISLSVIITAVLAFKVNAWCAFLLLPVWECVKYLCDRVFCSFLKPVPTLSMELESVPEGKGVINVITTLLCGNITDNDIFCRLEKMYYANGGDNIYFGVLGDLCDSTEKSSPSDKKALDNAKSKIEQLNQKHGQHFFLFVRAREYSKTQKSYIAPERKRGAVISLDKLLCGKGNEFDENSILPDEDICKNIKYCVTLDADTNMPIEASLKMVSAMLHPLNTPEIDKEHGVVKSGHGIMQPCVSPSLEGAGKNVFTRIMCGAGGIESYSTVSSSLPQTLFGHSGFCGKGIFDKQAFYYTVSGKYAFPNNLVLSHDALEGARLRCGFLGSVELTDSFPKNELSYFKREHRWIRGDFQNLAFVSSQFKNAFGQKVKNNISPVWKYRLFDNVRRELTPVFAVVCLILSIFTNSFDGNVLSLFGVLYILTPFLFHAAMIFTKPLSTAQSASRRFFSPFIMSSVWQEMLISINHLCMLCKSAFVSLDAMLRSGYRMLFSKKKLLEWTTAAQSDSASKDGLLGYVMKNLAGAVMGVVLFVFSNSGLAKLTGLMWFFLPAIAYFSGSSKLYDKQKPSRHQKRIIQKYAKDTWNFFDCTVTQSDNYLPPDNLQLFPSPVLAHRTSPTNIGLYMVSALCAYKFSFISSSCLLLRLENTLNTVEKLEKHKGHLYNWYDTQSLCVMSPKYISSVDSGNFLACVLCVYEALEELSCEDGKAQALRERLKKLFDDTDICAVYDKDKNLFSIGVSLENGKAVMSDNCYDLLMSEARTLSYIAVSHRKVPLKHWQTLSRMPIKYGEHLGLASWSGTAFEYFMPSLFLPVPVFSFGYEALQTCFCAQKNTSAKRNSKSIYGISESGYFAFDKNMNYQYKAFGIPLLSLAKHNKDDLVISPYSSFLFFGSHTKSALANLKALEGMGMYGEYGFYEAVDCTKDRVKNSDGIVKSHMAHHSGMSLTACANVCFENYLVKCFMKNKENACSYELLQEKIPVNTYVKKVVQRYRTAKENTRDFLNCASIVENTNPEKPGVFCISNGKCTIIASDNGYLSITKKNIHVNFAQKEKYNLSKSLFCFAELDGKLYSSCTNPIKRENAQYTMESRHGKITQISHITNSKGKKYSFCCEYTISKSISDNVRIKMSLNCPDKHSTLEKVRFGMYLEPVLCEYMSYVSHPCFSGLFAVGEYDTESNSLVISKKSRSSDCPEYSLAVGLSDKDGHFDFCISKDELFDAPVTNKSFEHIFKTPLSNREGACIIPVCFISTNPKYCDGKYECELILSISKSKKTASSGVEQARKNTFESCVGELCKTSLYFYAASKYTPGLYKNITCEEKLLSAYLYPKTYKSDKELDFGCEYLWKHGISADLPIVCIYADNPLTKQSVIELLKAFLLLKLKGVKMDVVLLYTEKDSYHCPVKKQVTDIMHECGVSDFINAQDGGVFALDTALLYDGGEKLFCASCLICPAQQYEEHTKNKLDSFEIITTPTSFPKYDESKMYFKTSVGFFCNNGSFVVDKHKSIRNPMSQVLSGYNMSSVITHNSLGYTFYKNAAICRLTPFYNDTMGIECGEYIYINAGDKLYDVCACSHSVEYGGGFAKYFGNIDGTDYTLEVCIPKKLPLKLYRLKTRLKASVIFAVKPVMGRLEKDGRVSFALGGGALRFTNYFEDNLNAFGFMFGVSFDEYQNTEFGNLKNPNCGIFKGFGLTEFLPDETDKCSDKTYVFALGCAKNERVLDLCVQSVCRDVKGLFKSAYAFSEQFFNPSKADFDSEKAISKALSLMLCTWLPYQNAVCRFFARSGFYQSGGAYGFRDQLQDCLCLMYSCPDIVKSHIIRCAAHQFKEGDVLHWWHPCTAKDNKSHLGVRTKISDDYLWLCYAVSQYTEFTGDRDILDVNVRYISAPELSENEHEKYIAPDFSSTKESIYRHCLKSLFRAYRLRGDKGLCLMGTGDWSDGLNRLGKEGKGQSVWLTMFLALCMQRFSCTAKLYGDDVTSRTLEEMSSELYTACLKKGYDKKSGYFARAFDDNGNVVGVIDNDECKIDLLPQCFAVFSGAFNDTVTKSSILNAYNILYDKQNKLFRLLYPPFDKTKTDVGYIKGYVSGTRENGGQYTHAAIWGSMALFHAALRFKDDSQMHKKLKELAISTLEGLLTPLRMSDDVLSQKYRIEPYVLAGDIYSNKDFEGRGGWSWYTGAAGWLYRDILNCFFGLTPKSVMTDMPVLEVNMGAFEFPLCLSHRTTLELPLPKGISVSVEYQKGSHRQLVCNGKQLEISEHMTNIRLERGKNNILIVSNSF